MIKFKEWILFLLLFNSLAFAQLVIQTDNYSVPEGLSNNSALDAIQDSYGLIWVTTDDGLNLFDGYKFKVFKNVTGNNSSILSNKTLGIVEDTDKSIWVTSDIGISKYERNKNKFKNYSLLSKLQQSYGTDGSIFKAFLDSDKNLWAVSVGLGVLKLNRKTDVWEIQKYKNIDSLSSTDNSICSSITEDKNKKLWIGSFKYGLMYYDNKDSAFVKAEFDKSGDNPDFTKDDNLLTYLYADNTGVLWITTRSGIYKYNTITHKVKEIVKYKKGVLNFWTYYNGITQDADGNIWIANNQNGILKFDGISNDYKTVKISDGKEFLDIVVKNILVDKTGIIWFTTLTEGLLKYNPNKQIFSRYLHNDNNPKSISGNQIFSIIESKINPVNIYVGTRGDGLNLFNSKDKTFKRISYSIKSSNDQFGGSVRSILENPDGSLWLGTWGDGLVKVDKNYKVTEQYLFDEKDIGNSEVRILQRDSHNNIWIGTANGAAYLNTKTKIITKVSDRNNAQYQDGLIKLITKKIDNKSAEAEIAEVGNNQNLKKEFNIIRPRDYLIVSVGEGLFSRDSVMSDYGWLEDSNNHEIFSSKKINDSYYLSGSTKNRITVKAIKLKPGKYNLRYKSDDSHSFNNWNAEAPTDTRFWGIKIFEISDNKELNTINDYLQEVKNRKYIKGSNIRSIHLSRNDIVWIGSDREGLNKYDVTHNKIITYSADKNNPNSISDNSIQYIYEDNNGILWLATNGGLNKFNPQTEKFTVFTEDDGLPTNYVSSILPGKNGNLWLSTWSGISKMVNDASTGKSTFVNFDNDAGIGGTDFIAQVALKTNNDKFYFGGEHGLVEFEPTEQNETPPSLMFSDLKISNVSVFKMGNENPLETSLYETKKITLPYDQNDLTFEFSALHYSNPAKNQYAHMLKGYDKNWNYDNSRTATYTNLDPGKYTFIFRGSNRDGLWNDKGKSIEVTIRPPWWFTVWAYIGYGLVLILGIFTIDRIQRKRLLSKAKERMKIQDAEHRAEAAELQAKATEAERRALEAEYDQKKKELEEARELQLGLLPNELPKLPNLDIAVYMKTATEVGGDYYDFHLDIDGTLTTVIGDATGHGMKAGTVVTATKSLFNILAPNPNVLATFSEISRVLKGMKLQLLSMCLTIMKINGNDVQISSAGMPPVLVYRKKNKAIEEIFMRGMPLGVTKDFPYELKEFHLYSGDTILMVSDGLPELMNNSKEMYGYDRLKTEFYKTAERNPEDIIDNLKNSGSNWANDKDPDDDVTFVVIKVK